MAAKNIISFSHSAAPGRAENAETKHDQRLA
jgi:hypothetical protein